MDATRFTYIGPPAYAGALAQELEARGLSVDYEPPMETKDLALAMSAVAVVFAATGPIKDIVSSVSPFKARFANARVEGLPDDEGPSLRERLADLDELEADGVISADEHAQQRARILGELLYAVLRPNSRSLTGSPRGDVGDLRTSRYRLN